MSATQGSPVIQVVAAQLFISVFPFPRDWYNVACKMADHLLSKASFAVDFPVSTPYGRKMTFVVDAPWNPNKQANRFLHPGKKIKQALGHS